MTEQITVPRETWDAMREALETCTYTSSYDKSFDIVKVEEALTAANAVSDQDLPVGKCGVLSKSEPQAQGDLQALDESDIEDLARSSFESAMAFGVDLNSYTKLAKHVWEKMRAHPQATEPAQRCWCETCRPVALGDMRMVVCPECGNKRCPKATHHDNACTNSNDIGQKGSSWEHVKPAVPEAKQ